MENKNTVLSKYIQDLLTQSKVGLLIRGVDSISPSDVLSDIRSKNPAGDTIYSSIVGYSCNGSIKNCVVSSKIEDAVLWRSNPACKGAVLVFIQSDSAKLHSLADFNVITNYDLSKFVITEKISESSNIPSRCFWEALIRFANSFTYDMLESFVQAVESDGNNESSITSNLWKLNMLPDDSLFNDTNKIESRLVDNIEKILAIGQLSEESRKRLSKSLLKGTPQDATILRAAYNNMQSFFKFGQRETLKKLSYSIVSKLLSAASNNGSGKKPSGEGEKSSSQISAKELDAIVNDVIVNGDDEQMGSVQDLLSKIKDKFSNEGEETTSINGISGPFEERTISVVNSQNDLRKLVGLVCTEDNWGGLIQTSETVLKDALSSDYDSLDYFSPSSSGCKHLTSENGDSLFDFIGQFDSLLKLSDPKESFTSIITDLKESRARLVNNLDLIMYYPVLTFGADLSIRQDLIKYIETWGSLYKLFCDKASLMRSKSGEGTDFIARALLLLDVLYIKTPSEWKAVVLPLHPMYLWRYYEVFKSFVQDKSRLNDEEKKTLSSVLSQLPQALNYVIVNKLLAIPEDLTLPCSGNIEMLPSYENKTNRYLGDDGILAIPEVLSRWVGFAPYSKEEVRICTIDVPNLIFSIREIKKFMDNNNCRRVVYDIYYTRKQNGNNELAKLDFTDQDYELAKYIKEERISITINNSDSIDEVAEHIALRPVHVAFFFDQSAYKISYVPNNQNLYINPLVVTYDYEFDEAKHKGRLYPSTESESGIIGSYHHMLREAHVIESNSCPSIISSDNAHINTVVSTVKNKSVQWLVVADRDTNNYNPSNSIPIGESQHGKRMIKVWAARDSRIISQYESIMRGYSLHPNRDTLIEMLSKFGHIASTGLISIPKNGADPKASENKMKGLLGTIFASVWYTNQHEGSLVASLDDATSRTWLHENDMDNSRADLIGLRYDETKDTLFIEPIEVKTRDENPDATYDSSKRISGHAADQIATVIKILNDIFSLSDEHITDMFVSARREVLKYQIVSECFRNIHDQEWQKKWCSILKRAFGKGQKLDINVCINGILVFIKLSESTPGTTVNCVYDGAEEYSINYVKMTSFDIQRMIFDKQSNPEEKETTSESESTESVPEPDPQENSTPSEPDINPKEKEKINETEKDGTLSVQSELSSSGVADVAKRKEEIKQLASDFKNACNSYKILLKECNPDNAVVGPSVIRLSFKLAKGQPIRKLNDSIEDISREMKRTGVLVQEVKNSDELKLDIPRIDREKVLFSSVKHMVDTKVSPERLPFSLGRTPDGKDIIKDLSEMPHMLVGGSTGSGKSVFLFTMLTSLLLSHPRKEDMQLIISSSKLEDVIHFANLPHLFSGKIISDAEEAMSVISDVVDKESERRMHLLTDAHVANIREYNAKMQDKLAPIVVVIDEFADLADQLSTKQERDAFYRPVQRIAQAGRSRGIHLVVCTQRPEAKLVPPTTKAQLNGRVALRVNDGISSRMIIDEPDAQYLQKYGDMIFKNGDEKERCQGYLISVEEVDEIVNNIIEQNK